MQSYQLEGSLSSKGKDSFLAGHFSLMLLHLLEFLPTYQRIMQKKVNNGAMSLHCVLMN